MMFNLESLNDYEFEILCKDILEKILDIELYTFAKGRDGGIDICDAKTYPTIIAQAKHYYKSSFQQLLSSLKKEVDRVSENVRLKKYYVCTSQSLTQRNKNEIFSLFSQYMEDNSFIIDASTINDFLSKDENREIVKKHYKLWLCASNVLSLISNQNVFIDCDELLDDIENSIKFFVETKAYNEALKKLIENRIIIITGNPGVGKSTLSKMLILKFVEEGYSIRYTTDNEIGNIKNTLSLDPERKEIVLLDDFLGQHYLKIKESQPNEIKSLIAFVKRNINKKLILNSRITILNEARQQSIVFNELMEQSDIYTYLVNLDDMSYVEKAKIVYNHLFFNGIPDEYYEEIRKERRYLKIVYHKNYNPRIIEYVAKQRNYGIFSSNEYFQYIIGKLDAPEDVWQDEFRNRLNEEDRILMNILYSLTDTTISREILEKTYNNRIKDERLNSSINIFKNSCSRLTDSLLKVIEDKGNVKIGTINPSVNDYLNINLQSNAIEQRKTIDSALYVEQIIKVSESEESKEYIKQMILNKTILNKKVLRNSVFYYYVNLSFRLKIFSVDIIDIMQICFERIYENIAYSEKEDYGNLLLSIIESDFVKFYNLIPILQNADKMAFLVEPLKFEQLKELLEALLEQDIFSNEIILGMEDMLSLAIRTKISIQVKSDADDVLGEIVASKVEEYDDETIENYKSGDTSALEEEVWDGIQDAMLEKVNELLEETKEIITIPIDEFDLAFTKGYFDISGAISAQISEKEYYDYEEWKQESGKSDIDIIKEIFER
ncbi:hypothetical protein DFR60_11432 [Hungatella effluvii]|uniref:Novel STAND NTPase 3 domain-containing protein n=1 Tax=Hungatella effluvii TaxID=1096246 RepID=A0A2V3Y1N5_9FIRM|nr:hypothetical protein [Hungatella effluvii]PXX49243.1 hypothetical protein DFR60_11432 [Hungatella effluvii]